MICSDAPFNSISESALTTKGHATALIKANRLFNMSIRCNHIYKMTYKQGKSKTNSYEKVR